jgi:nucleoid DNA-binding protein
MSGSGKGGNNHRRPFKRRERGNENWSGNLPNQGKKAADKLRFDKNRGALVDRPRWTPTPIPEEPLPAPDCPICGKPVKDISSAITDKTSGVPAHFDCVAGKIAENEMLESGDTVTYIGGGRFGVVHRNPQNMKNFKIKKILEWEDKENRAEWRKIVADHFSVT